MNRRDWSRLAAGLMIGLVPWFAVTRAGGADEPWPALLASQPACVDPDAQALQQRANLALERLLASANAAE